jgi:hypothetical protein
VFNLACGYVGFMWTTVTIIGLMVLESFCRCCG